MPSTNYWTRWDPTNKKWEFSTDQGSTWSDLVENALHETAIFNEIAAPAVSAAGKSKAYMDSTEHRLKLSENGGAFLDLNAIFTKSGAWTDPNGITGVTGLDPIPAWRAPFACTIIGAHAFRNGGTGATVNAKNAANDIRSADLSLTSADTWTDFGALQNTAVASGAGVFFAVRSVTGSPIQIAFCIQFRRS